MSKNYVVDKKKDTKPKKDSFFKKIKKFFKDTKTELKNVSWPTREQTIKLTGAVIAFVLILGAITGGFDYVVRLIVGLING